MCIYIYIKIQSAPFHSARSNLSEIKTKHGKSPLQKSDLDSRIPLIVSAKPGEQPGLKILSGYPLVLLRQARRKTRTQVSHKWALSPKHSSLREAIFF